MIDITLALPLALPPRELASDLQRELALPALATLLSRTSHAETGALEAGARSLPYEAWLAAALGLGGSARTAESSAPLAPAVLRGYGLEQDQGHWFIVHPVHIQMARTHLTLADPRQLWLDEDQARALYNDARPYFEEAGKALLYGDAHTWFLRADDWRDLRTASPDCVSGMNLSDWMPEGPNAIGFRKLQNEIQMLWHEHPVNLARQERGLAPVNSFWPWAGAAATGGTAPTRCTPAVAAGPAWLHALGPATRPAATLDALLASSGPHTLAVLGQLIEPGLNGDWSSWLQQMRQLEQHWFAPLLAALKDGRVGGATLALSHRNDWAEFRTSKLALHAFWRKPTLTRLST